MEKIMQNLELTLPIYEEDKPLTEEYIAKTYVCYTVSLRWKLVCEIAHTLKFETFKSGELPEVLSAIFQCVDLVNAFLLQMFNGLTMEDLENASAEDIAVVFQSLFFWVNAKLSALSSKKK